MAAPKVLTEAQRIIRREKGLDLLTRGYTFQMVADELGYGTRQSAWSDLNGELQALREQFRLTSADRIAAMLEQQDHSLAVLRKVQDAPHPLVDNGHVVRDGLSQRTVHMIQEAVEANGGELTPELVKILLGDVVLDKAPNVMASKEIRQLHAEQAKLLGLNKPVKVDTTTTAKVTYEVVGIDPTVLD